MGYSFVLWNNRRGWPCKGAWQQDPLNGLVLGSHVGRSLTGILNGPKSDRLQVFASEANLLVILMVDCITALNAVLLISGDSV